MKNQAQHQIFVVPILFFSLLFASCTLLNQPKTSAPSTKSPIVGVWQDMPSMAAGWSNRYIFLSDGTYIYTPTQMYCGQRIKQVEGEWSINNNELLLTEKYIRYLSGGQLVNDELCGKTFENYQEHVYNLTKHTPKKVLTVSFSTGNPISDNYPQEKMTVNGVDYWLFPEKIEVEFLKNNTKIEPFAFDEARIKDITNYNNPVEVYLSIQNNAIIYHAPFEIISESQNKIFANDDYLYLEFFPKKSQENLAQAIKSTLLKNYSFSKCQVITNSDKNTEIKDLTKKYFDDPSYCPEEYSQTNGRRFFTNVENHSEIFVKVDEGNAVHMYSYQMLP